MSKQEDRPYIDKDGNIQNCDICPFEFKCDNFCRYFAYPLAESEHYCTPITDRKAIEEWFKGFEHTDTNDNIDMQDLYGRSVRNKIVELNKYFDGDDADLFDEADIRQLHLDTIRQVRNKLWDMMNAYYKQKNDNAANRRQQGIVIELWNRAMKDFFVWSPPTGEKQMDSYNYFKMEMPNNTNAGSTDEPFDDKNW